MGKIVIRSRLGLLVQLLGVIASYVSIFLIARFDGPASQGFFVSIKSFVDTTYALFMAGLPQALILVINKKQFNIRSAIPYIEAYIILIFFLSIPITWKFMFQQDNNDALIYLPIGIAGMSTFALTRALLLTHSDGFFFSAFTAAPQSLILLFVAIQIFVFKTGYLHVYLYFGIALFIASQIVIFRFHTIYAQQPFIRMPFRRLLSENVHSFTQAILYNGQLFLMLRLLSAHGAPDSDLGKISTAVLPLLALHALIGIVAPIMYNQWSKQEKPSEFRVMAAYLGRIAALAQFVALLVLPAVGPVTIFIFGSNYVNSVPAIGIGLLAVFPVVFTRLISPYLQTSRRSMTNSASCVVRAGAAIALLLVALQADYANMISPFIAVWTISEWLALVFLLAAFFRQIFVLRSP